MKLPSWLSRLERFSLSQVAAWAGILLSGSIVHFLGYFFYFSNDFSILVDSSAVSAFLFTLLGTLAISSVISRIVSIPLVDILIPYLRSFMIAFSIHGRKRRTITSDPDPEDHLSVADVAKEFLWLAIESMPFLGARITRKRLSVEESSASRVQDRHAGRSRHMIRFLANSQKHFIDSHRSRIEMFVFCLTFALVYFGLSHGIQFFVVVVVAIIIVWFVTEGFFVLTGVLTFGILRGQLVDITIDGRKFDEYASEILLAIFGRRSGQKAKIGGWLKLYGPALILAAVFWAGVVRGGTVADRSTFEILSVDKVSKFQEGIYCVFLKAADGIFLANQDRESYIFISEGAGIYLVKLSDGGPSFPSPIAWLINMPRL